MPFTIPQSFKILVKVPHLVSITYDGIVPLKRGRGRP